MANVKKEERGKTRSNLLNSAKLLFYEKGVGNTTLADISTASSVPLGNIYYHFKSKDMLLKAVVENRAKELSDMLASSACNELPLNRLKALIQISEAHQLLLVKHGCPYASLIQDLDKIDSKLSAEAAELLKLYVDYSQQAFSAMGLKDSQSLAHSFIGRIQGAYVLARSLQSQNILNDQINQLEKWLDCLAT